MNLKIALSHIPHIKVITSIAKERGIEIYLVGGFLRDWWLNLKKDSNDFDFCVDKGIKGLVRDCKKRLQAKLIVLDSENNNYRLIKTIHNRIYTYDFSLMRGKDLKEDLRLRDFTINTLVVPLSSFPLPKLLDLWGAKEDLQNRQLRVIEPVVLKEDPLRILRAFNFVANLGFKIPKITTKYLVEYKAYLREVASERINEELFKILASQNSYKVIKQMSDLKIIDEIIPYIDYQRGVTQGGYHHLDVWGHSLETLLRFELLCKRRFSQNKDVISYLNQAVTNKHQLLQILKLGCLLHDIGKPFAKKEKNKKTIFHTHEKIGAELIEEVGERLKLAAREKDILKKLIFWHLRPGYLADQDYPSPRAVYRFMQTTGEEAVAVILLSLADWRATRGPLTNSKQRKKHERIMFKLIDFYFTEKKKKPLPRIVDGYDIMRKFQLEPSPLIGAILKKIGEEQSLGKVKNKPQAYKVARGVILYYKNKQRLEAQRKKSLKCSFSPTRGVGLRER